MPLPIRAGLAALATATLAHAAASRPPNIVLVFADDLGYRDTGIGGSDFFETPRLDAFARQGMVFENGYAAAANCAPSRACLLSGQYTPRHGVYAVGSTNRGPDKLKRLVPVPNRDGLAPSVVTMAEALKAAGYVTGHFGKWHLHDGTPGSLPSRQGFDVTLDSFGDGPVKEGSEGNRKGPVDDPKGVYTLTREACAFMEKNRDRPFFCYLAHHAVHGPVQSETAALAHFRAKTPGKLHDDPMYAGCIRALDDSFGRLLDKIDALGLTGETLVVFTSDNGSAAASQEPLRGAKGAYYEGGVREPWVVRWPGVTKPGSRCLTPVINQDLYPTFVDVAGARPPAGTTLDGESLLPLLRGGDALRRQAVFWHFPGYLDNPVLRGRDPVFRTRPVTVVRKGDWKAFLYHEEWLLDGGRAGLPGNGAVELYNLKDDPGERHDLAASNPAKRDELAGDITAWWARVGAPLPKPNGKPVAPAVRLSGDREAVRRGAKARAKASDDDNG